VRILDDRDKVVRAVLTDIRMPGMDGFELVRFVRSHRRHVGTPIIVVTADTDPETPERASRLGANAFFGKPFSPRAVRRALEDLLYADVRSE
jgi:CheY-like chemotaxis protein